MKKTWNEHWPMLIIILLMLTALANGFITVLKATDKQYAQSSSPGYWIPPSLYVDGTAGFDRQQLIYGSNLIAHTAWYFGPQGSIGKNANGMNCQNCHLQAGAQAWGNNYGAVFSTYPKFRDRSGSIESISKRVNDCFERSLNGSAIDTLGKEMKAIIAYITWLGKEVKHGVKPVGSGIADLPYPDNAADPAKGALVYRATCQSCHGANGEGVKDASGITYQYPPLWGAGSYNTGAGLFRISRFAGFIKDNMPFNIATHQAPVLSNEEAWNLAAFVNAQPRPLMNVSKDWPDISKKPVDYPAGPYTDGFSEQQHKFGPFPIIVTARKKQQAEQERGQNK